MEPFVRDEVVSLLFDIPVHTILTRKATKKQEYTVPYPFFENRLIEYVVCLENGNSHNYDIISAQLS